MPIRWPCQSCAKVLRAKDADAGKKTRCPHCKATVQIPTPAPSQSSSNWLEETPDSPGAGWDPTPESTSAPDPGIQQWLDEVRQAPEVKSNAPPQDSPSSPAISCPAESKMRPHTVIAFMIVSLLFLMMVGIGGYAYYVSDRQKGKTIAQATEIEEKAKQAHGQAKNLVEENKRKELDETREAEAAEKRRQDLEEIRSKQNEERRKQNAENRKKEDEAWWSIETKQEYLGALRLRRERMEADVRRLGSLSALELRNAEVSLARVNKIVNDLDNVSRIERLPRSTIYSAAKIAPDHVDAVLREHGYRLPEYIARVERGEAKARLPWRERKKIYEEFAALIGEPGRQWGLGSGFDDFDPKEMNDLIAAMRQSKSNGFRSLSRYQRLLILDAGGVEFFRKEAGISEK